MKFAMTYVTVKKFRIPVMTVSDLVVVDLKRDTGRPHSLVVFAFFRETSVSVNVWIFF